MLVPLVPTSTSQGPGLAFIACRDSIVQSQARHRAPLVRCIHIRGREAAVSTTAHATRGIRGQTGERARPVGWAPLRK